MASTTPQTRHVLSTALVTATLVNPLAAADGPQPVAQIFRAADRPVVGLHSSGARVTTPDDEEHGDWLLFHGEEPGDFVELTLPGVLPGRYRLVLTWKAHAQRGSCRLSLGESDGSGQQPVDGVLDQRGEGFRTAAFGPVVVDRMGHRTLRLTLEETHAGIGKLSLLTVALQPAPLGAIPVPTGLQAADVGSAHAVLRWDGMPADESVLVAARGGKVDDWRVVGTASVGADGITVPGLCDASDYAFRVCRVNADGRSAWSAPIGVRTVAADHAMRGRHISRTRARGRIGGGSMVRREDGSLLLYAHYQTRLADQGRFEIHALESEDGGASWSERRVVLAAEDRTYMMPALTRLRDGSLLFCYTERDLALTDGRRFACRSSDDGATWSEPVPHCDEAFSWQGMRFGVPTGPHDRLLQTSSGRIVYPIHYPHFDGPDPRHPRCIVTRVVLSDDGGRSWRPADRVMAMRGITPASSERRDLVGLWEAAIVELSPGELLMYLRSNTGWYYESRSHDDGSSWSPPRQSSLRAPLCPAKLVTVGDGRIAALFNGIIDEAHPNLGRRWDLASVVSDDGGASWQGHRLLEYADPQAAAGAHLLYCYPSLLRDGERWHLTYYKNFQLVYQALPGDWFAGGS